MGTRTLDQYPRHLGDQPGGESRAKRLRELAALMLKIGGISFGGPAAHISLLQDEVVERRQWLDTPHFLDLVAATNLIPGPNASEMAMYIGLLRAGWIGLVVGGLAFLLPGAVLSGLLAWVYLRYGALPEISRVFSMGIEPVVLVVVLATVWRLGRTALRTWDLWFWAGGALILSLLGVSPVWIFLGTALAALLSRSLYHRPEALLVFLGASLPTASVASVAPSLERIGLVFLKTGALLFGSGMVLFAFLERELVPLGWLSRSQLVDAIAVGQMTPGPVLSSATFIGWLLAGPGGAIVATVAIFLPAFVLIAVGGPRLPRLRTWLPARHVLNAVAAASLGVLLSVGVGIGRAVAWDVPSGLVAAAGLFFLAVLRFPAWYVFFFGIVAGLLRSLV